MNKKIFCGIIAIAIASIASFAIISNIADSSDEPIEVLVQNLRCGVISPSHFRDVVDERMKSGTITMDEYNIAMDIYRDKISHAVEDLETRLRHDMITADEYKIAIDTLKENGTISCFEHEFAMEAYYAKKGLKSPYALDDETKARVEKRIKEQAAQEEREKKHNSEQSSTPPKPVHISSSKYWKMNPKQFAKEVEGHVNVFKVDVGYHKTVYVAKSPIYENGRLVAFSLYLEGGYQIHKKKYNKDKFDAYKRSVEKWAKDYFDTDNVRVYSYDYSPKHKTCHNENDIFRGVCIDVHK